MLCTRGGGNPTADIHVPLFHLRTQEEMAHTCRGTINLAGAVIDAVDSTHFVITNGATQVFHLRALNEVERQRWVTALELAKSTAIRRLDGKVFFCVCVG